MSDRNASYLTFELIQDAPPRPPPTPEEIAQGEALMARMGKIIGDGMAEYGRKYKQYYYEELSKSLGLPVEIIEKHF